MKKELENGKVFTFSNDEREAKVSFSNTLDKFIIWFNGELIHSSKTFPPTQKRLDKLIEKWGLERR